MVVVSIVDVRNSHAVESKGPFVVESEDHCILGVESEKHGPQWEVGVAPPFSRFRDACLASPLHVHSDSREILLGYELLGTSYKINKVLHRCNDETLLEPHFLKPLWKANIGLRGVKLSISVMTLKKHSYHARSVFPSFCSMTNSSLRSRFTRRVVANL
ncbi:hypothetical protein CRG98_048094 [Punica granatum]|uniref:Uncharacterized protein n=1 Tax=Punica granatum TaxID=22663 RepID=A0A2I0HIS5_PUNGR|nr:hypothetical protein CRG98_048094 [Punica granatum]